MENYSIAVHGGAGADSDFIRRNIPGFEQGLKDAVEAGNNVLKVGGTALTAVLEAVKSLEDNPLFNAGKGSAINNKGEIQMDASIMDGKGLRSGAVSMVKLVKNPVSLARYILENTSHVFLSGDGALEFAKSEDLKLEPESYFVTEHQFEEFEKARKKDKLDDILKKRIHGTVGAVAIDKNGNIAAATSTGGTENSLDGRIGDACIIGAGCYANNKICGISGTGDGEYLINNVIAHSVAMAMDLKGLSVQEACDYVIHERNKETKGDIGVIAVDGKGKIGISYNSERMHRAWQQNGGEINVRIY